MVQPTMVVNGTTPVGTAFLTTDGKIITARHCVEYWIAEDIEEMPKTREVNDIRKWAVLAETFTITRIGRTDSLQMLRVFFSLYKPDETGSRVFSFCSTDPCVHINRWRDGHLEFGDYANVYYWRTVQPNHYDMERELGDIVYIDVDTTGTIELADSAMIEE